MGGLGSGVWIREDRKRAVGECYALDVNKLASDGLLVAGNSGILTWSNSRTGERLARAGFSVSAGNDERILRICYSWNESEDISSSIRLQTTRPNFGGERWWFTCPITTDGLQCNRRVGKLYLSGRYFGCRHCHDLTYESCRESHGQERMMARIWGCTEREAASMLRDRLAFWDARQC